MKSEEVDGRYKGGSIVRLISAVILAVDVNGVVHIWTKEVKEFLCRVFHGVVQLFGIQGENLVEGYGFIRVAQLDGFYDLAVFPFGFVS